MAAPAAVLFVSYTFRDAKGQTAKVRCIIGDATAAACVTDAGTLQGHLATMSNASVRLLITASPVLTYGGASQFQNVVDKAQLAFSDPLGGSHRFLIPAPIAAAFKADLETVDNTNAAVIAVVGDFQTFVFGHATDTAPLVYRGGIRTRKKMIRKFNLYTKDPALSGEGE